MQLGSTTAQIALTPVNTTVYQGVVTWFRGSYGWLSCEAVSAEYTDIDIMVHKNDCSFRPRLGDKVCFRLALNDRRRPQAVRVKMETDQRINARDWFDATASERSNMLS